ncbi:MULTISPECIES: hypothetical protein [unclassified Coleofasciculus]|uniref:hypothetical protein n=1 Tax=unclassified Coleofasciculus TaxID=2692782 RepID=UPI002AD41537|nr:MULTISPECIES: hypothetical protein [unclassified Coleofasciculus]
MARRRPTILEVRLPNTPDFVQLAQEWCGDASMILLAFVWDGYDLLHEVLSQINWNQDYEELERSITQRFVPMIRKRMTGDEPFSVEHGPYEFETRMPPPAQSPQYDIAFVLYDKPGIMWPLEAKVLRSVKAVAPYVKDIKNEFLKCRYAPFSSEGGMLGYLLSSEPNKAFRSIQAKLDCELNHHPRFPTRYHKTSDHQRTVPEGKNYPRDFRCHHLILQIFGDIHEEQALPDNTAQSIPGNPVNDCQSSPPP